MRVEDTHILSGQEVINSCGSDVFLVLTDIHQHYQRFAPGIQSITILTPNMPFGKGFQWQETRRVLYLREECIFTVKEYDIETKVYKVCMDDGFNRVFYRFTIEDCGLGSCLVNYHVDCRHVQEGIDHLYASQPSERLARMMANQDGQIVKRLKAHIESRATVQCF